MKNHLLAAGLCVALLASLGGCAKKEEAPAPASATAPKARTIEVVKEQERSRHFLAVSQQLELGGPLYGYVDVDGDVLSLAGTVGDVVKQIGAASPEAAPFANQDWGALFTILGLTDIKAAGFSSVPDGTGYYRNRTFFYAPEGRHGLLAGLGGKPAPFARLGLAPANTDFYSEAEMDLPAIYATVREVAAKVASPQSADELEAVLKRTGENVAFSLYSFIQGLKGRAAVVMRLDPDKELRVPSGPGQVVTLPAISLLICIDGVAPAVEPMLAKQPFLKMTQEGPMKLYSVAQPMPVPGLQPVLAIEGNAVFIATTVEYLRECRAAAPAGLAQSSGFKEALARVGPEGNALTYLSPNFFRQLRRVETLNPQMPAETKRALNMIMGALPETERPLVSVRRNLPDGILVQSYWNRSLKQDVATLAIYNPMTVGLMAAMAIPAFQKVRATSQEKAVLNNLRQLSAAADQYYLEHGVETTTFDQIVGPDKYVRRINPVAGEDYRGLSFKLGRPLRVTTADGRKISYPLENP